MANADAMYFKASADGLVSTSSTSSRAFKMVAAFVGGFCLMLLAVSGFGPNSQADSAAGSTNLYGLLSSTRAAKPSLMMPKTIAGNHLQAGWRKVVQPGAPISRQVDGSRSVKVSASEDDEVGKQYASAFFGIAAEQKKVKAVHTIFEKLRLALVENEQLRDAFMDPGFDLEKRTKIIKELVPEEPGQSFLLTLQKQGRQAQIAETLTAFDALYNEQEKICVAKVTSAHALSEQEQFQIAKKVQELSKCKSVKIKPGIDESLIGGSVIEFGDDRLDFSVIGDIRKYGKQLAGLESQLGKALGANKMEASDSSAGEQRAAFVKASVKAFEEAFEGGK